MRWPRRGDIHTVPMSDLCQRFILRWDFDALAEIIGAQIPPLNRSPETAPETEWTDAAMRAFAATYRDDLAVWGAG